MEIAEAFRFSPSRSDKDLASLPCVPSAPSCRTCLQFPIKPQRGPGGLVVAPSAGFRVSSLPFRDMVIFISSNVYFLFSCLAGSTDGLEDCQGLGSSWPWYEQLGPRRLRPPRSALCPSLAPRPSVPGAAELSPDPCGTHPPGSRPLNPRLPSVRG